MRSAHIQARLAHGARIAGKNHPARGPAAKQSGDKPTDSEAKRRKQEQKAMANPTLAAKKKHKNDACRDRRKAGSWQTPA